MNPRFLRTFLTVARLGHVTRAAETLHLAQSSVSDQIQALESELGARLFARTRQGLRTTPAGEALRAYAEHILALTQEARAAVAAAGQAAEQTLTIGALETIAATRLPAWLSDFRRAAPGVTVHVRVAGSADLARDVRQGALDAAFGFGGDEDDARLARRVILNEPLVLITPPRGPAPERFIVTERGCVYRRMFDRAFAGMDPPPPVSEANSLAAIGRLVASGAGKACAPLLAVADLLARGEVAQAPWPGEDRTAPLFLIWRRRAPPPVLRAFLAAAEGFA